MGAVIPFVARVRDSGDWSAAERAKLEALADRFADDGVTVEVVYGQTDDGDPWCVIKDDNEEILLHVARIGGAFVVHYAADDSLAEAPDLPTALSRHLMAMEDPRDDDVVVPFAAGRHAQILIALLAATAFFYETRDAHAAPAPEPPAGPEHDDHAAVAVAALTVESPRGERSAIAQGASDGLSEAPATPSLAAPEAAAWTAAPSALPAAPPEPAAAEAPILSAEPGETFSGLRAPALTAEAPHEIVGTDAGESLTGTAGADLIRGEGGDDTLSGGGAPSGHLDTLDGGAGDDRIEVNAQVVAIGGAGADTFVIQDPDHFGDAGVMLGFIADFRPFEGDRIIGHHGHPVTFLEAPPDAGARFRPPAPPAELTTAQTTTQVFVDLNGDGRPDGFLMLGPGRPSDPQDRPQEPPKPDEAAGLVDLLPAGPPPGFSLFGGHDLG